MKNEPASDHGDAALDALFASVEAAPWAHDFFALLRRVENLHPQSPRIGTSARPIDDLLRLGQEPELDFAAAALDTFDRGGNRSGGVPRLGVRLFGLFGPQGPMPLHFTEYVRERLRQHGDAAPARFLDVFHHRLLSLFYRAWAQAQPAVQHDRPDDDRFAAWLGAGFGLGRATAARDSIPDAAKLYQAGLLGSRSRHAEGLDKLLRQFFGVPVRVEQNLSHWLRLQQEDRSRLGRATEGRAAQPGVRLGVDAAIGSKVHDRQSKFRIVLGPLSMLQYLGFVPGEPAWRQLRDWVDLYAGRDLMWEAELCLARAPASAPPQPLSTRPRLGLTAWVGRRAREHDRRDLRLRPHSTFNPVRAREATHV